MNMKSSKLFEFSQLDKEHCLKKYKNSKVAKGEYITFYSERWIINFPCEIVFIQNDRAVLVKITDKMNEIRPNDCAVCGWLPNQSEIDYYGLKERCLYWWVNHWNKTAETYELE